MNALRPLLSGIVDYAGLFPPAGLGMADAVRNYAEYLTGSDRWMLGRFVVPVSRLGELETELEVLDVDEPWPIAALLGSDVAADVARVREFNDRQSGRATVDTLEGKFATPEAIADAVRTAGCEFAMFVEIPSAGDPRPLIQAMHEAGANAKIRTGGLTPDAFPPAADVVRFIRSCVEEHVLFKATAGLHHPLRAEFRLTYEPNAPRGVMYGYLNVFLTAAMISQLTDAEAVALLDERDPRAFQITRDAVRWRGHELRPDELGAARDVIAASFGSCSFREPVDELRSLPFGSDTV